MIEILILNLKPGTRDGFHQLYITNSLPLQKKWNIRVMAHGPSHHDQTSYYVIRSFDSLQDRQKKQDAFYSSDDWQKGPRTIFLSMIDSFETIVVPPGTLTDWAGLISK